MKSFLSRCLSLINRETISYLFFGVVTTLVNYVVYYGCRFLSVDYLISNVLAWIVAVAVAYVTNKLFVFESRSWEAKRVAREVVLFAGARVFSLVCETLFLIFTVEVLHAKDGLMKLVAAVFVIVINYIFSKLFIFKKENK